MSVSHDPNKPPPSDKPPQNSLSSRSVHYGAALLSVGVATLLRLCLTRFVGPTAVPFITYFPAVVFSAWLGGLGPGIVSLVLGTATAAYLFLPPVYSFTIHNPADLWSLGTFLFVGLGIAAIGEAQRRAQSRAQASQESLVTTIRSIGDAVIATDTEGLVTFMNPVAETLTGWKQAEALGKDLQEVFVIVNEETRQSVESPVARVLREGVVVGLANHTVLLSRNGKETPIDDSGAPIRDEGGNLRGVILVFHDVTERRHAEQIQRRLAATVESCEDAIIGKTLDAIITDWNPGAERLYGYAAQEAVGQPIAMLIPPDRVDELPAIMERLKASERIERYETVRVRKDGSRLDVALTISPIRDSAGQIVGASTIARDITERKRLEDQLLQSQKLESVGRLAGGVAHDFNNLLTAILGHAELMEAGEGLDETRRDHLSNVRQAAERAANLTRQLLAFARRQVIEPKVVNLNDLILGLDKMLHRLITENVALVILPEEGLHTVKVDPGQFEQILVNLVVNARDAMPDGGKITIETRNAMLDEVYARQHGEVIPGEYVMLAVSDTGSGMDEAIRLHIFEPFFTTKEKGRGTGLGLATVYGIVRQAGGHIWLYSEPGEGTTFKIYLPRTTETPSALPSETQRTDQPRGSETILVVEDEAAVRALTVSALRGRGYTVLEAADGEEALQRVEGREPEISLLITDVVMPKMSGKELAERLHALNPRMKVLYASGYTENTVVHHGVLEAGVVFLQKPFTPTTLAHKVREALEE